MAMVRRITVAALLIGLVGAMGPAGSASAAPPTGPAPRAGRGGTPAELAGTPLKPIEVVPVTGAATSEPVEPVKGRPVTWPAPGQAKLTGLGRGAKATQVPGQALRVGVPEHAKAPAEVQVRAEERQVAEKAVGLGAVWTLTGEPGATVSVQVDYSGFAGAGGAGWAGRLGLSVLPECAITTPDAAGCQGGEALVTANDVAAQTLSAEVTLTAASVTLAAAAATAGPEGDVTATSLAPSSSWSTGGSSGAFTWSYPMAAPPAAGGLEPDLTLGYTSQVANGRVGTTNNQGSLLGEGFDLPGGFIERRYSACADEVGSAGANNTAKTGDRCWATDAARTNDRKWDNATLSLPGHSGELVRVGNTTQWRLKTDDGTRVEKLGTPGASGEKWKVTTTDGTQYFFGASSTAGVSATNAVWTLPVAGNHAGEPGYNAAFASSFTTVPWRWNLDYVVSINGDSMTYLYNAETNKYKQNKTTVVSYTRGGYLKEIRYGERAGAETTSPPAKVTFTVAERCFTDTALTACATATPTAATAYHWPDVPVDAICTGDTCTATQISPTFFTRKKLTQLNTYVTIGTTLANVDRWSFGSGFPNPGDASSPALWLQSITHAGVSSGTITLPTVTLTPTMKPNRIAGATSGTPITRPRLGTITTESGGKTTVTYTGSDCTATSLPTPETNTRACFPAFSSEGTSTPTLQWFHLYRVSQVLQQDTAQVVDPSNAVSAAGAVGTRTTYSYAGGGAWRYDDSVLTPAKYRTWGIWRGYATTTTVTGDPGLAAQPQQVTQTTYFRGMNGDRLNSGGGTRTVGGHRLHRGHLARRRPPRRDRPRDPAADRRQRRHRDQRHRRGPVAAGHHQRRTHPGQARRHRRDPHPADHLDGGADHQDHHPEAHERGAPDADPGDRGRGQDRR